MSKFLEILFGGIALILILAVALGWHFGLPYLAHMIYLKFEPSNLLGYGDFLAIWFGIYFVRQTFKLHKAKEELKRYELINSILGGVKIK